MFLFPAIFSILRLAGLLTVYKLDTPFYYFRKGDRIKGRLALGEIYYEESVHEMEKQYLHSNSIDVVDEGKLTSEADMKIKLLDGANEADEMGSSLDAVGVTNAQKHSFNNRLRVGMIVNFLQ